MDSAADAYSDSVPPSSLLADQHNPNPSEQIVDCLKRVSLVDTDTSASDAPFQHPIDEDSHTGVNGVLDARSGSEEENKKEEREQEEGVATGDVLVPAVAGTKEAEEVRRSSSVADLRDNSEIEVEESSSPSGSGYAGERGSNL